MPLDHDALLRQGIDLSNAGQIDEALKVFEHLLAFAPNHLDALNNRGVVLSRMRRFEEALASFNHALEIEPNFPEALRNLGSALGDAGDNEGALSHFGKALELDGCFLGALLSRSRLLTRLGRNTEAIVDLERILEIEPVHPEAVHNRAIALMHLARYDDAMAGFERLNELRPDDPAALNDHGFALAKRGYYHEALTKFNRALELKPVHLQALVNSGFAYGKLLRYEDAIACFDRALAIKPDYAEALNSRGVMLSKLGRFEEALESACEALSIRPDFTEAHVQEGVTRLRMGDFPRGLRKYEWRRVQGMPEWRPFEQPLWMGRPSLAGRSILLHSEQGLGDLVQFARYVPLVAAKGAKVILEVPAALAPIVTGLLGVNRVLVQGETLPETDFHCPLLSLPLAFNTDLASIPADIPYLWPPPDRVAQWKIRFPQKRKGMRVGLAWSGNVTHVNDHERSIRFELLAPLLSIADVQFVCLQKEIRADDAAVVEKTNVVDHSADLRDLADTAAVVSFLDLVVTVDTSVAHLAGAMGKPVWILLPFASDWRWLVNRDDSPWYPSAKLYRQSSIGDWHSVVRLVGEALALLAAGRGQRGKR